MDTNKNVCAKYFFVATKPIYLLVFIIDVAWLDVLKKK
jgi:hypothetical protein